MEKYDKLEEVQLASEEIYPGRVVHLYKDTVQLPNGKVSTRETIRHPGAVAIVPLTDDGKVVMEHQFRYPVDRVITEIPAGKLDSETEDRLQAAKRELKEETGLTADYWENIGDYYPTPAYSDERITLYLATGLHAGTRHLDDNEFLNLIEISLEELVEEIMQGKILDGKTQTGILKVYFMRHTEA